MTDALFIALWGYLFTGPLSEPGQVFGWLKWLIYNALEPDENEPRQMTFNALIGCAKCHAGQIALWWQVVTFAHGGAFDLRFILIAIAGALALEKTDNLVSAWTNR